MVIDHRAEYPSEWAAIVSVAEKLGPSPQTLSNWLAAHRVAHGTADSVTMERSRIDQLEHDKKKLEQDNKELKRANEILKAASVFFATELDGQSKK